MLYFKLNHAAENKIDVHLLKESCDWLRRVDLEGLDDGDYVIAEGSIMASVMSYETKPISESHFECHKECIEIQYIVSGQELFGIAQPGHLVRNGEDKSLDNYYYKAPKQYSTVIVHPGEMLVLAPSDIHASHGAVNGSEHVKKIIIKFHS